MAASDEPGSGSCGSAYAVAGAVPETALAVLAWSIDAGQAGAQPRVLASWLAVFRGAGEHAWRDVAPVGVRPIAGIDGQEPRSDAAVHSGVGEFGGHADALQITTRIQAGQLPGRREYPGG